MRQQMAFSLFVSPRWAGDIWEPQLPMRNGRRKELNSEWFIGKPRHARRPGEARLWQDRHVSPFRPVYFGLTRDELRARARDAIASLADCRACPRDCRVNRLENAWAACKTGRHPVVSSFFPHFGEEDCLRGWNGSGTIFFGHCNLRCVFCQNYDISQDIKPQGARGSTARDIANMMMWLQLQHCHNINFVTPEHVAPNIVEAVAEAVDMGLALPIVYNTSAYDALESIELMDGIVDIYMPDFKYWSSDRSKMYMKAADYPDAARAAIIKMHAQVGPLVIDEDGLARRGLLIRHLVMPGCLDETRSILEWIASELGRDTYVNLMDQYYPAGKVNATTYSEINRRLTGVEFDEARQIAAALGLRRLDTRRPHHRLRARFMSA
jgi:putative pyruvate formate lyase activating enzyme